jgi:hypothetical protein
MPFLQMVFELNIWSDLAIFPHFAQFYIEVPENIAETRMSKPQVLDENTIKPMQDIRVYSSLARKMRKNRSGGARPLPFMSLVTTASRLSAQTGIWENWHLPSCYTTGAKEMAYWKNAKSGCRLGHPLPIRSATVD